MEVKAVRMDECCIHRRHQSEILNGALFVGGFVLTYLTLNKVYRIGLTHGAKAIIEGAEMMWPEMELGRHIQELGDKLKSSK